MHKLIPPHPRAKQFFGQMFTAHTARGSPSPKKLSDLLQKMLQINRFVECRIGAEFVAPIEWGQIPLSPNPSNRHEFSNPKKC
jgi:hypothetical protein